MKNTRLSNQEYGFGVLEVLIAVAILSIALLSLGGLHSKIIQSSSAAKARATATSLAQEKIDDLRSYRSISAGGNGDFGFDEIVAANGSDGTIGGGEENADGTLQIPSGDITISNITYNRTWVVNEYSYCGENAAPTEDTDLTDTIDACGNTNTPASFKLVTMTLNWTDREGPQSLVFNTAIAGMDPSSSGQSGISTERGKPTVTYNPGAAPDVIPISLDDTTKKEATKPQPDTTTHKHSTLTTFDEITYNSALKTNIRDAFFTVNCVCEQLGANAGSNPAGNTPTTFDGDEYIVGTEHSTKRTGQTHRSGQFNEQTEVCDICCRDHHDAAAPTAGSPSTFASVYDPFRAAADYTDGDHNHYYDADNNGDLELANATNDLYYESCRIVRNEGLLRVLQDWRMEAVQAMPSSFLQVSSNITSYQEYVTVFVKEFIKAQTSAYPETVTNVSAISAVTAESDAFRWDASVAFPAYAMEVSTVANDNDDNNNNINDVEKFIARGIYMDYIDPTLMNMLKCKVGASPLSGNCDAFPVDDGFLNFTPFHEVNVTRLANWSKNPSASTAITVTSEPIEQGTELTYDRGTVTGTAVGSVAVVATIKRSNTGLTDSDFIDETATVGDADDTLILSDNVALTVTTAVTPPTNFTVTGAISTAANSDGRTTSDIQVIGSGGATCTKPTTNSFSCTLDASGNGTIIVANINSTTQDNCADPSNPAPSAMTTLAPVNDTIYGLYPTGEYRQFVFTGATADIGVNFNIKKATGGCD